MKRADAFVRIDKEKVDPLPKKRKGVKPVSDKRRDDWAEREHVRRAVIARDKECVGPRRGLPGRCGSPWAHRPPLEAHEVCPRGRDSTSWLDEHRIVALCQFHHDLCTSPTGETKVLVEAAGLLVKAGPVNMGLKR